MPVPRYRCWNALKITQNSVYLNSQANDASTMLKVLQCTERYTDLRMYLNTWANDARTTLEVLECTENYKISECIWTLRQMMPVPHKRCWNALKIEQISECIWTVVQMVPVPCSRLECTENYTNLWMYAENSQATAQI